MELRKPQKSLLKRKKKNKATQKTTKRVDSFSPNHFFNLPPQPGLGLKMGLFKSKCSTDLVCTTRRVVHVIIG